MQSVPNERIEKRIAGDAGAEGAFQNGENGGVELGRILQQDARQAVLVHQVRRSGSLMRHAQFGQRDGAVGTCLVDTTCTCGSAAA